MRRLSSLRTINHDRWAHAGARMSQPPAYSAIWSEDRAEEDAAYLLITPRARVALRNRCMRVLIGRRNIMPYNYVIRVQALVSLTGLRARYVNLRN